MFITLVHGTTDEQADVVPLATDEFCNCVRIIFEPLRNLTSSQAAKAHNFECNVEAYHVVDHKGTNKIYSKKT